MKKYILPLICFFLCIGCQDWLDVDARSETKEEVLFEDEEGFKSALTGVYIQLATEGLYGAYTSVYVPEFLAQNWKSPGYQTYVGYYLIDFDYNNSYVEGVLDVIWRNSYKAIVQLNNILENLEVKTEGFSNGNYNLIKGEVLGLRAFIHFDLLRLFGPVPVGDVSQQDAIPFVDKVTKDPNELLSRKYEVVIAKIEEDLNNAEEALLNDPILSYSNNELNGIGYNIADLNDSWQLSRQYRFNYYTVLAIKARFYQWIGKTDKATEYAKMIIEATNGDESLKFELATEETYSTSNSQSNLIMFSEVIFGVHNPRHKNIMENRYFEVTAGNFLEQTKAYLDILYESTAQRDDIRYKENRYWATESKNSLSGYQFKKYIGNDQISAKNIIPIIRLAEMYFIVMENLAVADAMEYLSDFRIARNLTSSVENINTQQEMEEFIEKEFHKDFYGEGQMFYFYKRKNYATLTWPVVKAVTEQNYVLPKPEGQLIFE